MKIAIYGPMCSGKSTIASIIKENNSDYEIFSFGQKIKDLAYSNVEDVLQGRQANALQSIKKAWASTTNSASGYVDDAKDYTEEKLQGKLSESLHIGKDTIEKLGSNPWIQAFQNQARGEDDSESNTE